MTAQEFAKKAIREKLYDKAKKTLCATSDGSIFIDGDIEAIEKQAVADGLEFFPLKGYTKKTKDKSLKEDGTTSNNDK
jgi:hypothetical protein